MLTIFQDKVSQFTNSESNGKFSGKQVTAIITGQSRKGYRDMQGNKINDPTILSELKKSNKVISYREVKHGKIHFAINKLDSRFLLKSKKKSGQ